MENDTVKKEGYSHDNNPELLKRVKAGDKNAVEELIKVNMPLVSTVSKKFVNRGFEYEDLFQLGCIGLVKAITNFDESYNVKFSTYAVPMIMGEIRRFIRDDGLIKVSRSIKETARKVYYEKEKLSKELGREPSLIELSKFAGVSVEEIVYATESACTPQYLYDPIYQDDGAPVLLIDRVSEKGEEDEQLIDRLTLKEALEKLDVRARQVIMLRYFKDKTQNQVAKMLGISQVQVSRIEKKVLEIMKKNLTG